MKKVTMLILSLSLCIVFCACDTTGAPKPVEPSGGNDPTRVFLLDEYNKLISSQEIPDNFVYYDDISSLGEFYCLTRFQDDFSSYCYTLRYDFTCELNLYIREESPTKDRLRSVDGIQPKDMRTLATRPYSSDTGIYAYEEIEYEYVSGELLGITWEHERLYYTLCGSMRLSEYPYVGSTVVGKMLNLETAPEAINSIFE